MQARRLINPPLNNITSATKLHAINTRSVVFINDKQVRVRAVLVLNGVLDALHFARVEVGEGAEALLHLFLLVDGLVVVEGREGEVVEQVVGGEAVEGEEVRVFPFDSG